MDFVKEMTVHGRRHGSDKGHEYDELDVEFGFKRCDGRRILKRDKLREAFLLAGPHAPSPPAA